tara:strand:+ start:47129 stop:47644 length:516 start_codon:yes stop_codon:yes gene_type:complete
MKYLTILLFAAFAFSALGERPKIKPKPEQGKPEISRPSNKPFPPHWGRPPAVQTKDFKKLPFGFGMGSSTLAKWILNNVKKDKARPPRPDKPKPSPEMQAKIKILHEKKKEMNEQRNKLRTDLKGKSKEDVIELIKAFKEANKDKHQAIKEAQKALLEEVRSKRQTGDKRE